MTTDPGPSEDEQKAMVVHAYLKERRRGCDCQPDAEVVGIEPNAGEDLVPAVRFHHHPRCALLKKRTSSTN